MNLEKIKTWIKRNPIVAIALIAPLVLIAASKRKLGTAQTGGVLAESVTTSDELARLDRAKAFKMEELLLGSYRPEGPFNLQLVVPAPVAGGFPDRDRDNGDHYRPPHVPSNISVNPVPARAPIGGSPTQPRPRPINAPRFYGPPSGFDRDKFHQPATFQAASADNATQPGSQPATAVYET